MADNKKYYYMRLNENYFDSDTQVLLESMPDGYLYSNILLKLYLKSLKNDGRLMFNDKIPFSPQMIATVTRHQIGTVEKALQIFRDLNIIDVIDTGAIYMTDIQNYIGKSNTEADRKRAYRKRIEEEKGGMGHLSTKCPLEIEKEIKLEKEIEIEKDINQDGSNILPFLPKDETEVLKNEFEQLWKLYPKKVGKEKAYGKYKKFRTSKKQEEYCTYEEVLKGLEKYLEYIKQNSWYSPKNGDTWFNNRSWNDEYEIQEQGLPEWFNKDIDIEEPSSDAVDELEEILKGIK
jgi:predicted phage replisome organizer